MEYTNRKGDHYFIFEGRTKTGKPKYFASRKAASDSGTRLVQLPDDYEIAEHPSTAVVSIRKIKPTRILDAEVVYVRKKCFVLSGLKLLEVEHRGDQLTIYTPDRSTDEMNSLFSMMLATASTGIVEWIRRTISYTAMLRLTLVDEDDRIFASERFCFRGGIDDWIPISYVGRLEELAPVLFPTLGDEEAFYELM